MKIQKKINFLFKNLFFLLALEVFLGSCSNSKEPKDTEIDKKQFKVEKNEVAVIYLKEGAFEQELVSNGKLVALQKNVLQFEVSEKLKKLNVKNGDRIQKGEEIARLESFKFQQKLNKAAMQLKKTQLEFEDLLVGRGYEVQNRDSIPKKEYEMLAIRSGYKEAQNQVADAEFELNATKLKAPFNGKVANIKNKQYEYINAGKEFGVLIDDTTFEVEFYLIESEIGIISLKDKVEISPFAFEKNYQGKISSINPLVEKNGTVLVKAKVKNDGKLLEGMNVKVRIQKQIPNQFVVPKSAVILRQNQEVLFKVIQGKAFWTYVQTTRENSHSYAVIPHPDKSSALLNSKDTIIVSGNLNLAHDSEVMIKK